MNIDSIKNGYVIDHIKPGKSFEIYNYLDLGKLDESVAIIKNARSSKTGKKDIIKINEKLDINLDILGYLDSISLLSLLLINSLNSPFIHIIKVSTLFI